MTPNPAPFHLIPALSEAVQLFRSHAALVMGIFLLFELPDYAWQLGQAGWSLEGYARMMASGAARPDGLDWMAFVMSGLNAVADGMVVLGLFMALNGQAASFSWLLFGVAAAAPRLVGFALAISLLSQLGHYLPGGWMMILFNLGLYSIVFVFFFLFTPACLLEGRPVWSAMKRSLDLTQGKRLVLFALYLMTIYPLVMLRITLHQMMLIMPGPVFLLEALILVAITGYFSVLTFVIYRQASAV